MSIFDKFKKEEKEEDVVSNPESAKVDIDKKNTDIKSSKEVEEKSGTEAKKEKKKTSKDGKQELYGILVRPLITEKASNMSQSNKYVFEVSVNANKIQIAQSIEQRYGVKPEKVNVLNNLGRTVRSGRNFGKTKAWRKAVITLPKGKTIQIHEGV